MFMFMVLLGLEREVTHASKMAGEGLLLDSEDRYNGKSVEKSEQERGSASG